jgi:hypothetical protein
VTDGHESYVFGLLQPPKVDRNTFIRILAPQQQHSSRFLDYSETIKGTTNDMTDRQFFVTAKGYVGLTNEYVRVGDVVDLAPDMNNAVPFITVRSKWVVTTPASQIGRLTTS